MPTLQICTVGGSTAPVLSSIRARAPERIILIHSPEGVVGKDGAPSQVDVIIKQSELPMGIFDLHMISDAQDFEACVSESDPLRNSVHKWQAQGEDFEVVVDITGGTKCMSSALAMVARRWRCTFSYIGGTERTKGGMGVVVDGRETALISQNPWNALGFQAIEDASLLFDRHAFRSAVELLERARNEATDGVLKSRLSVVAQLCEGYDRWDRFDHAGAKKKFEAVRKNGDSLRAALPTAGARVLAAVKTHEEHVARLIESKGSSFLLVGDLFANARRRAAEGRYDDTVARLYRGIEALAQATLARDYGINDTSNVSFDHLPADLQIEWKDRVIDGSVRIALQDGYRLLSALGSKLGELFQSLGLGGDKSALAARNKSILAHGFEAITDNAFKALERDAAKLETFEFGETRPLEFPWLSLEHA